MFVLSRNLSEKAGSVELSVKMTDMIMEFGLKSFFIKVT